MTEQTAKNEFRAWRGRDALQTYKEKGLLETGAACEDTLADLLTDLCLHFDVGAVMQALKKAALHHYAETNATDGDPLGDAASARYRAIGLLAKEEMKHEGTLEVDELPILSEDKYPHGCYVMAWAWLDFSGTPFDKEPEFVAE